jgi:hypothetical protein
MYLTEMDDKMKITLKRCLALLLLSIFSLPAFAQTGEPAVGGADSSESVTDTDPADTDWDDSEIFYLGGITVTGTRSEKRLADTP